MVSLKKDLFKRVVLCACENFATDFRNMNSRAFT